MGQRQGAGLPAVAVPTEAGRVRRPRTHSRPGASGSPAAQGWFGPRAWRSGLRRAPCPPLGLWRQRGVAGPAGRSLEQCALRETHVPTASPACRRVGRSGPGEGVHGGGSGWQTSRAADVPPGCPRRPPLSGPALRPACPGPSSSPFLFTAPFPTLVCCPTQKPISAPPWLSQSLWPTLLLKGTCHLRSLRRITDEERRQPAAPRSGRLLRRQPLPAPGRPGGVGGPGPAPVAHAPPRAALSAPARFTASRTPTGSWCGTWTSTPTSSTTWRAAVTTAR